MPLVTLGPKGQLTIPVDMLEKWDIKPYDKLEINLQNNVITMVPAGRKKCLKESQLTSFAGVGQGCWGDTPEDVKNTIRDLRDSGSR